MTKVSLSDVDKAEGVAIREQVSEDEYKIITKHETTDLYCHRITHASIYLRRRLDEGCLEIG